MIKQLLFIGLGSFIGGIARYLLSKSIVFPFPFGTMTVNILGCLLFGIFYGMVDRNNITNSNLYLFLTVGLCGGFTTFSSFIHENYILFQNDHFLSMAFYSILSYAFGLGATYLGHFIIKTI